MLLDLSKNKYFELQKFSLKNVLKVCSGILLLFLLSNTNTINAQALSNIRTKTFFVKSDTIKLDTLSIVPNSIIISTGTKVLNKEDFRLFPYQSLLIFYNKPQSDSCIISYRVFPFNLAQETKHKDFQQKKLGDIGILMNPFEYRPEEEKSNFSFGGLDYSGSLSRGISFGNNQDLILNSSLNLQLSGYINPDIEVNASLTDNNIPIQPDGNTQNLQEFDKIFILMKLYKNHSVLLGDILNNNQTATYFKKYVRNIQGLQYNGKISLEKFGNVEIDLMGGVARGKFARNNLTVTEGNQGPYKLRGNNGETFIIILAGSERVFVNSQLMVRGLDQDYIIDYNLGEIIFTPKRLITKDLRVSVEFNYAERNYLRTTFDASVKYNYKNFNASVAYFTEQDAKNQSSQQNLSNEQKAILRTVGDSVQFAQALGAKREAFSRDKILYVLKDTTTPDAVYHDTIFAYSFDSTENLYYVSFTQVGVGKGNYKLASSGSNGRVYTWIAPIAGIPQGDYEPIQQLIAPAKMQMYNIQVGYNFSKNNKLKAEISISNKDPNTFSKLDSQYHIGLGAFVQYDNIIPLSKKDTSGYNAIYTNIQYEFIQKNYSFIERYRDLQFARNWNLDDNQIERTNEHSAFFSTKYVSKKNGEIGYGLNTFVREGIYQGFEHKLLSNLYTKQFKLTSQSTILHANSTNINTLFIRPIATLQYKIKQLKNWKLKAGIDNEYNASRNKLTDTLTSNSRVWQQYTFSILSPDTSKNKYSFEYIHRREQTPNTTDFNNAHFIANTFNLSGEFVSKIKHQLIWNLTYRHINETDTLLAKNLQNNYYLGRIEYRINELKGFIRSTLFYELGAGREPKTEFTFIEAPNGNGQYAYIDINNNGVRELNEYYISQFIDLNRYIKIYNTTTELVNVNTTTLNATLNLTPSNLFKPKQKVVKFINRFTSVSALQLTKKVFANKNLQLVHYFNPTTIGIEDTQLVSNTMSIRNSVFFNRTNPKYAIDYNFTYNNNKTLLTNGFEIRKLLTHNFNARWNLKGNITLTEKFSNGYRSNYSAFFTDRRYKILFNESETEFAYLYKQLLRTSLIYNYSFQSNASPETNGQFMVLNSLKAEIKVTSLKQGNATASFSFVNIAYKDTKEKNTQVEFAMLQGLQNGRNYIWNLTYARKISENIELIMSYDGRKTGQNPKLIHTGSAQIRAVF
jgi:hypothetical protein